MIVVFILGIVLGIILAVMIWGINESIKTDRWMKEKYGERR
jgi:capsular polysaccharide biosynthesis protein